VRIIATIALILVLGAAAITAELFRSPISISDWISNPSASFKLAQGENPAPVTLVRPVSQPLSAMAQLGKAIFYDQTLSASGKMSCSTCHNPTNSYAPANDLPAQFGGPDLKSQGVRAVPSLMYLQSQPNFYIGPDPAGDNDNPVPLPQLIAASKTHARATKTAQSTAQSAANIVPEGGLFWDGRVNTLQGQAYGPLLSPYEMDGGNVQTVVAKLQAAPYAHYFTDLFGPYVFQNQDQALAEALFAVARYQVEEQSFHPYSSKYDAWLEGKARLTQEEMRGYILFNDVDKGDCAACHLSQPTPDGLPPLFTDHQYEALGAPRNPKIAVNDNASYYDLGICGPYRDDLKNQTQYCGMFLTPTLRNSATRQVFFHNGVFTTLQQVLDFYNFRDVQPGKVYPMAADGTVEKFNDLPKSDLANIDNTDPPLDRTLGQKAALSKADEKAIIAFIKTLNDGYYTPTAAAPPQVAESQ
jgi:cytochrome c peroxidase